MTNAIDPLNGLFVLNADACERVYDAAARARIDPHVRWLAAPITAPQSIARPELLAETDVIFSGWGAPRMDRAFIDAAPRLKAVFYGAGSISSWATPLVFERGIVVTTATAANAVPVAEYTLATLLFSLKHGWRFARQTRDVHSFRSEGTAPGNYKSVVGLIGLGYIGRLVAERLRGFDLDVVAYDPHFPAAAADALGVRLLPLDELFATANAVSIHAPDISETTGLITGELIRSMKPGGTLINTARGRLIREAELIAALIDRPDLQAVLDVTYPEPPVAGSPLYTLANVVLTPHIAGSTGPECARMGLYMAEEFERFVRGEPLKWRIDPATIATSAHRAIVG